MTNQPNFGRLILRVGISGLMLFHGIPKLMNLLQGNLDFPDPIGLGSTITLILAVLGEAVAPILIIIGLKTRISAVVAAITMAVAAFIVHADDPFGTKEKALLFLVGFVAIALLGAGKFSVDRN